MMARTKKLSPDRPQTTAQQLGSLIKSARDIMRKDKGLSTDIDRLPMLDLDHVSQVPGRHGTDRGVQGRSCAATDTVRPSSLPTAGVIGLPREDGITGAELLAFINQDETTLPDGRRGPGLLAYLRALQGGDGSARRRRVIATVFKDMPAGC